MASPHATKAMEVGKMAMDRIAAHAEGVDGKMI